MPDALLGLVMLALFYAGYRLGLWTAREEQKEQARYWTTEG